MLSHRFKHYQRNVGWRYTVINLVIMCYLLSILFSNGFDLVTVVIALMMGAGVLLPRLFLERLVANPYRTTRLLHFGTFFVMAIFVLNFTGIWTPPVLLAIMVPPLVGILIGGNFWLFSDPRVLTGTGIAHYTAYDARAAQHATRSHHDPTDHDNPTPLVR